MMLGALTLMSVTLCNIDLPQPQQVGEAGAVHADKHVRPGHQLLRLPQRPLEVRHHQLHVVLLSEGTQARLSALLHIHSRAHTSVLQYVSCSCQPRDFS